MANWSEKPYRGQTSFNVPEILGWSNMTTFKWGLLAAAIIGGAIFCFWLATKDNTEGIESHIRLLQDNRG